MTDTNERHMIRLDRKPQLFSFRVAGLLFMNDHILVQRGVHDSYWALPGGRAEIGESSEETLVREMQEELERDIRIEQLVWSAENFFGYEGYHAHELAFYYRISLVQPFPFHEQDIVHRIHDGVEVEFRWLRATRDVLVAHDLRPVFISERIDAMPARHEHLIVREGIAGTHTASGDLS